MEFLAQLWLPIVASAVLVFVASSLIHMVIKWHNSDYRKLTNEEDVRAVVRAGAPSPGQYVVPHCPDMKEMQTAEMQRKFQEGPVAFVTVRPSGQPSMGKPLVLWFVFILAVSTIAAYLASKAFLDPRTFLGICRLVGGVAFLAYAGGSVQQGIWMGRPWGSVVKDLADAAIYAAITAATFAWLWKPLA
jgi:hypothetical protein